MDTSFQILRRGDVIGIKDASERIIGFNAANLEVAHLSQALWSAMNTPSADSNKEALDELNAWQNQNLRHPVTTIQNKIRSLTINVTQVCNLHCKYCAAGGDGSFGDPVKKITVEKTLPQLKYFLEKMNPGENFRLTFLGGEPLLYPEGISLLADYTTSLAQERGFTVQFVIVTNGTLFNEKSIALINAIGAQVTISLDGPARVNDQLRPTKGGSGATAKIEEGLKLLMSHRKPNVVIGVSGVFGKLNTDLVESYLYYRSLGVDWYDFTYDHLEISEEVNDHFLKQIEKVMSLALEFGGEQELRKIKQVNTYFNIFDSKVGTENYCGAGKTYLVIDARNQLYTCPWVVGDKEEIVGTGTNLDSQKLAPYQDALIEKNDCKTCWARYVCGGGCMFIHKNSTGSKHEKDPRFCKRTRYYVALSLLAYEKCRSNKNITGAAVH